MNKAYIALGTNIEPRDFYLSEALNLLEAHESIAIQQRSSIYETDPVGFLDQADFLNMVIEIQTLLDPLELLDTTQGIEEKLGRTRDIRFGPRTIDLDILLYNQENSTEDRLTLPHPRMCERAFVLVPLAEIASNEILPDIGKAVREQLAELPQKELDTVRKK
ncbi:2-amino-4-hydroxy-6-hydroxymethyldihydropteridine diphosphokinase [Oceanobacillus alkalisoli]|uniref:2-amino-4-hydroxy-6- hydroxymethyldihydropteridine diphosphokinase n=1 Tax=Oceanobacillus alkalisoli TaxID=2925113 RepID=UPI001EE4962A|nr:2-amino-4-hydroxy-6-hydroxymethyldihydropteridine diphosphokinase [Oceanobacillus alkalisoli]MCG5105140.1 2-amino-4-hydroxy-6-hydroxymethyldihydropteridine diphosphokinase [Oceanobacillus alkalisoli]